MKNNSIMVVGSSNYDIVLKMKHIPAVGETILAKDIETGFGGKGANQAITIARLKGNVKFLTCLGDDVFGHLYFENFKNQKLDIGLIKVTKNQHNGVAIINVDEAGRNNIVVYPGASSNLTPELLLENLGIVLKSNIIITQLEIPLETVMLLSERKTAKNIFVLNPSPVNKSVNYSSLLKNVDILIPNEIELSQLSGLEIKKFEDIKIAAGKLLGMGVKNLVITLGANGVFVKNEKIEAHIKPRDVKVVDTEAAGDIFAGAFIYYYSVSGDIKKSADYGSRIAEISITRYGAQKSIPTESEIMEVNKLFKISNNLNKI
ncbi:MAG: ribokinase [Actinobacteria bacterium]|nr:ribokinase [Actinomycetota bacterium]